MRAGEHEALAGLTDPRMRIAAADERLGVGAGRDLEPKLRAAGASAYVTKPFSPFDLLAQIEALLP